MFIVMGRACQRVLLSAKWRNIEPQVGNCQQSETDAKQLHQSYTVVREKRVDSLLELRDCIGHRRTMRLSTEAT